MKYYAVIDTNVIVAALLTKNKDSATLQVVNAVLDGTIIPLYHQEILAEYSEVLHRPKFGLKGIKLSLTGYHRHSAARLQSVPVRGFWISSFIPAEFHGSGRKYNKNTMYSRSVPIPLS